MQTLTHKFNMDTLSKLTAPAAVKFRQLQKIVQDIKKNDGSILDKLRRFKNKSVPRLPARDYRGEDREDSEDSDPEYDNETYEAPGVDDSYEPPPSHQQRVFSSGPLPRGEYVDSCRGPPNRPLKKPHHAGRAGKRLPLPPRPNHQDNDEEDYISPDGSNDDDNYIEPEEHPPQRGRAVRNLPKVPEHRPSSPDCYEVPDTEMKPQLKPQVKPPPPVLNRLCPVPSQTHSLPPTPSPRLPPRSPTPEPTGDDEYEVCDANDKCSGDKPKESRPLPHPKPRPRQRSPKPPIKPKLPAKPSFREFDSNTNRTLPATPSEAVTPPSKTFSLDMKRPKLPVPHFMSHKQTDQKLPDAPDSGSAEEDKEAELQSKPWFADSCDRRTADDVLVQSNQDGAFLVRKSSGHDAQQPYTLVVLYNGRVYNIPIRFLPSSQQFALGREKKGEEYFSSLTHIIEHHQRTPLVLIDSQSNNKDATRLCVPVKP
ncbi:B-cell linker protein isoform X2 [Boleophthalmus pectinirostris]|uniref:B-cell linker protein isoform X2 n=1 Tax=Boleophthalmus pectinirostris TaxID=150288 RepID=UPI00242B1C43|nr:B-cell linker protein isoform X2 [Boleophthalmus pectinirostris]